MVHCWPRLCADSIPIADDLAVPAATTVVTMGDPGAPAGAGRPRLVIARLELENFKSYAGVQQIGPFHKVRRVMGLCTVVASR